MTKKMTYKGAVYPWHCDHMGHMNVMWYVGKFDEATWSFFADLGLKPSFLRDQQTGMAALDQHLVYIQEVMPGDTLEVHTSVLEIKSKTVRFLHVMSSGETGEKVATCELIAAYLDTNARKAIAFPSDIRQKAEALI